MAESASESESDPQSDVETPAYNYINYNFKNIIYKKTNYYNIINL